MVNRKLQTCTPVHEAGYGDDEEKVGCAVPGLKQMRRIAMIFKNQHPVA